MLMLVLNTTFAQDFVQMAKILANDRQGLSSLVRVSDDNFGYAVAISGNYAIVGMHKENQGISENAGSAIVFKNIGGEWVLQQKLQSPIRTANDNFGYSVAINGQYIIVGAPNEDEDGNEQNTVSGAGAAYIYNLINDTWVLQQKISPTEREFLDLFGSSVSISGNYVLVGAHGEDDDALGNDSLSYAGSAYIFERSGNTWVQQAKLVAADRAQDDYFAYSVALNGDYAVIGAYREDQNALGAVTLADAGSAYIFTRSGTTWTQQQKIVASDRAATDYFGYAVAIDGDKILVGAYLEDHDAAGGNLLSGAGSAYIFSRTGTVWIQQQKLVAADRKSSDGFGRALSISGNRAVIGAWNQDGDATGNNPVSDAGSAYVFLFNGTAWSQEQKLVCSVRASQDLFGHAVAVDGTQIIVGAPNEDENEIGKYPVTNAGGSYIFLHNATAWLQSQKIVYRGLSSADNFGQSVSISGNYAIVGSLNDDEDVNGNNSLKESGAAYIFYRNNGIWTFQQKLVASDRSEFDNFGNAVAIDGDYAIVGSWTNDSGAVAGSPAVFGAGSVYIFHRNGTNWIQQQKIVAADRTVNDYFGHAVDIKGDFIVVGADSDDEDATGSNPFPSSGSAYIFMRTGNTWLQVQKLVASHRTGSEYFGLAVSIDTNFLVIGAPGDSKDTAGVNPYSGAGSAYIFIRTGANWTLQQKIIAPDRSSIDGFGRSVAISGDHIIIGAPTSDASSQPGFQNTGSAYVFQKNNTRWNFAQKLSSSEIQQNDEFGSAVSISGDLLAIGAFSRDEFLQGNYLYNAGRTYMFKKGTAGWSQTQVLMAGDRESGDRFGYNISLDGDHFISGAYEEDHDENGQNFLSNAGSSYIYEKVNAAGWNTSNFCPPVASLSLQSSITGVNYQWQVNKGNGFLNITNDNVYTGAASAQLTIQASSSMYGYLYRCIADGALTGIYTIKSQNTWTGAANSTWLDPLNWSCGSVPDANTDVIINTGTVLINSNVIIRSLVLGAGVNVTVNPGFTLTILNQ